MHYLMSKNIPVLSIENACILNNKLLPYSLRIGEQLKYANICSWINSRALPLSRKNSEKIYKALNLPRENMELHLMFITHSLSINDNYWIADESEINRVKYEDISLFSNSLNKAMYMIALRGDDGYTITEKELSAEYTGQGTYPKCFVREQDGLYMYKSGKVQNMYNEIIASNIAVVLGFRSAIYSLGIIGGVQCTRSKILSNKNVNWETALDLAEYFGKTDYKIPQDFALYQMTEQYCNMVIFDAITLNDDRHVKNWAFEFDSNTNNLIGLAPSYDYNNCFLGDKNTMSLLMFNGQRHINILSTARLAYRDFICTLDFNNLINYIDSYDLKINKTALKNRIKYTKGEVSNQYNCY